MISLNLAAPYVLVLFFFCSNPPFRLSPLWPCYALSSCSGSLLFVSLLDRPFQVSKLDRCFQFVAVVPSGFLPCLSFFLNHSIAPFAFGAVKPFRYDFRYFGGIYSEKLVSLAHYRGRLPISNHIMRLYSMISYRYLFIRNERRRRTFDTLGKEQLMDVKEVASELVNYTRTFPSVFAILPEINTNHGFDFAGLLAACHITNKDI